MAGVLGALGIEVREEELYRVLVTSGGGTADELAVRTGLAADVAEKVLAGLEVRGLATRSRTRPGRWVAAPPGVALRALLNDRRHELEQAEVAAAGLADLHRPEPLVDLEDAVEAVVGAEAVARRFLQLQLGAVHEICALVTENPVAVTGEDNEAEDIAVARGVVYRTVIERAAIAGVTARAAIREGLMHDMEVRVVDRVPTKLVIADGTTAMVPLSADGEEPAALVVRSPGLVAMISALFELVWRNAWPLRLEVEVDGDADIVEHAPGPDEIDRQLLALLLTGASDARVAKQLDLGLRTVQRRVRALMDLAGASTRIQLGWAARDRGWVAREG